MHRSRLVVLTVLAVAIAGCQTGERTTDPDLDGDGLPDIAEEEGWNITVRSTVRACFSDAAAPPGVERAVKGNKVLLDQDADGLEDLAEFQLGGDPADNDTDDDGLLDGEEVDLRDEVEMFNPPGLAINRADSDDDCLADGAELRGFAITGIGQRATDPTVPDTDHDGYTDAAEIHQTRTDPTNADTDGDGAADRLDADPLRDIWMQLDLQKLLVREAPSGSAPRIHVTIHWNIPAKVPLTRPTPTPRFQVEVNQEATVPSNNTVGLVDLDDRQGNAYIQFQLVGYQVDAQGGTLGVLDFNPHDPGDTATVRIHAPSGKWSFQRSDGTWTPDGNVAVLDGAKARLAFALSVRGPP